MFDLTETFKWLGIASATSVFVYCKATQWNVQLSAHRHPLRLDAWRKRAVSFLIWHVLDGLMGAAVIGALAWRMWQDGPSQTFVRLSSLATAEMALLALIAGALVSVVKLNSMRAPFAGRDPADRDAWLRHQAVTRWIDDGAFLERLRFNAWTIADFHHAVAQYGGRDFQSWVLNSLFSLVKWVLLAGLLNFGLLVSVFFRGYCDPTKHGWRWWDWSPWYKWDQDALSHVHRSLLIELAAIAILTVQEFLLAFSKHNWDLAARPGCQQFWTFFALYTSLIPVAMHLYVQQAMLVFKDSLACLYHDELLLLWGILLAGCTSVMLMRDNWSLRRRADRYRWLMRELLLDTELLVEADSTMFVRGLLPIVDGTVMGTQR